MPRDHFISDNLINIRDRLRQNYEMNNAQSAAKHDASGPEIHIDLKNPVIQTPASGGRSAEREYNELAGRIQHDLAAVSAELEELSGKQDALEKFRSRLCDLGAELQNMDTAESLAFFREFDRLRINYFQSSGEVSCIRNKQQTVQLPVQETAARGRRDFLLPSAILVAALIIALTLLVIF